MTLKASLYAHKRNISRWIDGSDVMNNLVREVKRGTARHVHSKVLTSSNQVHLWDVTVRFGCVPKFHPKVEHPCSPLRVSTSPWQNCQTFDCFATQILSSSLCINTTMSQMTQKAQIWASARGSGFPLKAHVSHCSFSHVVILDLEKTKQQKHGGCDPGLGFTSFKR